MGRVTERPPVIFNSPIELGTRAALILASLEGKKLDIDNLVLLDYALLYSNEFGGPDSLHPLVPNHIAEIAQRRELLPDSLHYFLRKGLIDKCYEENGQFFTANSHTLGFVSCLASNYYKKIWKRLSWLSENYIQITNTPIIKLTCKGT